MGNYEFDSRREYQKQFEKNCFFIFEETFPKKSIDRMENRGIILFGLIWRARVNVGARI
jgi:hypothetical protein